MKYEKVGLDPEAAQFLQSRKFQVNEIARIFRIPPSYLADLENSSTRANVEQQSIVFVRDCLQPYVCLLYTSPSPRDRTRSRMPSSA